MPSADDDLAALPPLDAGFRAADTILIHTHNLHSFIQWGNVRPMSIVSDGVDRFAAGLHRCAPYILAIAPRLSHCGVNPSIVHFAGESEPSVCEAILHCAGRTYASLLAVVDKPSLKLDGNYTGKELTGEKVIAAWAAIQNSKAVFAGFDSEVGRAMLKQEYYRAMMIETRHDSDIETRAVMLKKRQRMYPDNVDVLDLCRALQKRSGSAKPLIQIARDFTGESMGNSPKADMLMRQARRYPHLWRKSGD